MALPRVIWPRDCHFEFSAIHADNMLRMLAVDHRIEFKGTSNNFIAGRAMQVKLNGQRHVQGHGERMPCQRNQLPGSHAHAVLVTLVVEEHAADVEQIAASRDSRVLGSATANRPWLLCSLCYKSSGASWPCSATCGGSWWRSSSCKKTLQYEKQKPTKTSSATVNPF